MNFNSRDASSNKPQLVIQTSANVITPTPSQTTTSTPTRTFTPTVTSARTPTSTPTATIPGILTFTPAADARVNQASPTTNYGTATTLQVDGDAGAALTTYIRFAVSGLSGPIQNVKLRVFCATNGTINGPAAYLADSNWVESGTGGITWNTKPVLLSGILDNQGTIATNSWVEYDVTALVTGDGNYTFALIADGNDGITFSAREGMPAPQLFVTLGAPNPTSTLTSTPVVTVINTPTFTATTSISPSNTPTLTPTLGSGNLLTFITEADARVVQTSPTTNFSTSTNIQADGDAGAAQISYIRFTVSGSTGPPSKV